MARASPARWTDRGQTSLDFVVGMAVFLVVLSLTLSFVPEMFVPFDDQQERPLVTDRVSDRLLGSVLGDPASPSTLAESCTFAFFGAGSASGCGFDASESVPERVGVGANYRVNVSIQRNLTAAAGLEPLCTDGSGVQTAGCGTPLSAGPPVPVDHGSVSETRRTVFLDGRDATLVVRVW